MAGVAPEQPVNERPNEDAPSEHPPGRWVVLLLLLPPLALFSDTLFGDKVLSQLDALLQFQPWSSVAPAGYEAENPLLLDQALLSRPWLEYSAERIRAGELPLWNPYNYCGQPITAAVTGATYWPLHFAYYAFPTSRFHAWSAALRVFLAGLFTWFFLRRLGAAPASSLLGAGVFMQCGFLVAWLNHPHTNAAICLPLLLLQVERLAARPNARRIALLALAVALPLLGGHLQTATHVLLATGLYALFRARVALREPALEWSGLVRFGVGCALGIALAAPQLLPFIEYYAASLGKDLLDAFDTTTDFELGPALLLMVAPDALGGPHTGNYSGPLGFNLNYNELIGGFVGRVPLVLAALQLVFFRRSRAATFFGVLALIAALIAWRVPPFYEAARSIPLLRSTKLMRLLLLVAFGLAVLASLGLERLVQRIGGKRGTYLAIGLAVVAMADLTAWGRGYNPAIDRALIAPESPLTRFLAQDTSVYRALGIDNHILLPNANLFHRVPMVSGYDSIEYRPMAELVSRLSRDPLAGFEDILQGGDRPDANFIKEIQWFDRPEALPLLSLLGVKYLLSGIPLPAPFELVLDGEVQAYENPNVLPRAFVANGWVMRESRDERLDLMASADFDPRVAVLEQPAPREFGEYGETGPAGPAGQVTLELYEPRRLRLAVEMTRPGLVVIADAWDPGWSAASDGRELPIERVDHALRGIFLPGGRHLLELRYQPWTTSAGLWTAALAGIAAVIMLCRGARRSSLSDRG